MGLGELVISFAAQAGLGVEALGEVTVRSHVGNFAVLTCLAGLLVFVVGICALASIWAMRRMDPGSVPGDNFDELLFKIWEKMNEAEGRLVHLEGVMENRLRAKLG